jgi:hypothetical protein
VQTPWFSFSALILLCCGADDLAVSVGAVGYATAVGSVSGSGVNGRSKNSTFLPESRFAIPNHFSRLIARRLVKSDRAQAIEGVCHSLFVGDLLV